MLNVRKTSTKPTNTTSEPNVTKSQKPTIVSNSTDTIPAPAPVTQASKAAGIAAFTLDKGVDLPPSSGGGGRGKYPWAEMEAGDSFFIAGAEIKTFYTLTSGASKKFEGRKYLARRWQGDDGIAGVRVWRTV